MKRRKASTAVIALTLASVPLLAGCGSSGNNSSPAPAVPNYGYVGAASCGVNGCNYGNNLPYPTSPAGCIPITSQIVFSGQGVAIDVSNNIYGGVIPGQTGTAYGTMVTGAPLNLSGPQIVESETSGALAFTVQGQTATGTYGTTTGALNGTLTIGPLLQQKIMYDYQGGYGLPMTSIGQPYGGYNMGTIPCVSGIAMAGHVYTTGGYGFGGQIYLYMNNTPHGEILNFY